MLTISSQIRAADGSFVGIVAVDILLDTAQRIVSGIKIDGFPKGYVKAYSDNGTVIGTSSREFLGKSVSETTGHEEMIKSVG